MPEIIYILTNEAMPDLIKIGMTDNLERRVGELSRASGVPLPFEVYYACEVESMTEAEPALHDAFLDFRVNPKREFFKMNPERVVSVLRLLQKKDVTPNNDIVESKEEQVALDMARSRRPRFNFEAAKIPIGSQLKFLYDETKVCEVASRTEVMHDGRVQSLNQLTLEMLRGSGRIWKAVQGPAYWLYEGETLDERRRRLEESV
jgi:hypothetical protein